MLLDNVKSANQCPRVPFLNSGFFQFHGFRENSPMFEDISSFDKRKQAQWSPSKIECKFRAILLQSSLL